MDEWKIWVLLLMVAALFLTAAGLAWFDQWQDHRREEDEWRRRG